jgi:protein-tyrosine phosphatase
MEGGQKNITVVCTGNICRSPMAASLLAHALQAEKEPLRSIQVHSAGVSAFAGDPASTNACRALKPVKLDISSHRSRPLSDQLADQSDLILTMTSGHIEAIRMQHPGLKAPVYRFREWIPSGSKEVPDPFGGPLDLYVETRDHLAEAIPSIISFLKEFYKHED